MLQRHADEASRIAKAVVQQGPLGRGCQTVLVWLLDAADSSKQTQASTRAKAIKALGLVAEIDPELLAKSTVQGCLNKALQVTFTCATCASRCAILDSAEHVCCVSGCTGGHRQPRSCDSMSILMISDTDQGLTIALVGCAAPQ